MATGDPKCDKHKREGCLCGDRWDREREASGPLVGAAAVRELTGRTSEETARRKVGVLHWRSFALTIGCGAQGPNEGATTVIEHVTCTACLSAYTHNDYPAAALPTVADVEHDGDRAPRASRDAAPPLNPGLVALAPELAAALLELDADDARVLLWAARELPRVKLRAACERATATGWVSTRATDNPARRTEEDGARAALLAAVRLIEPIVGVPRTARRERDEVLGDEEGRLAAGGGK